MSYEIANLKSANRRLKRILTDIQENSETGELSQYGIPLLVIQGDIEEIINLLKSANKIDDEYVRNKLIDKIIGEENGRDDFIVNPSETTKEEIRKIVEECKESVSKMFSECLDELYHRNVTFETDDLVLSLTQKEYDNLINKRDTHGKVIRKHEIFSDESTDVQIRWIIDKEGVEKLGIRGSILFFRGETEAIEDLIDVVKKHIKEKIKER